MNASIKERIRNLFRLLPLYKREYQLELSAFQIYTLENAVKDAIHHVPYYAKYKDMLKTDFQITDFNILRKTDIMGHEQEFISRKEIKCLMSKKETGGSTGMSLELYYSPSTLIKKNVMSDYAFSLIGDNLRTAILRGNRPSNGNIVEWVDNRNLLLSSYQLSEDTLDIYISNLKDYKIECLHVYPSSLSILARLIKKRYTTLDLPCLKGILSSSEIFSKDEKILVMEVFPNAKLVDLYGHNELACCAISVDDGYYKFYNNYGYVEFINTGERINGNNKIAEIVATSIMNYSMPFIRYATDDYVELDTWNNVVSIIGRTSDFVVNASQQVVPCIVCTRHRSMENVVTFQYYQDEVGVVIFRVKLNGCFSQKDIDYLQDDLDASFNDMQCKVEVVNEMTKTKIGKQSRLIQKLDINKYR